MPERRRITRKVAQLQISRRGLLMRIRRWRDADPAHRRFKVNRPGTRNYQNCGEIIVWRGSDADYGPLADVARRLGLLRQDEQIVD